MSEEKSLKKVGQLKDKANTDETAKDKANIDESAKDKDKANTDEVSKLQFSHALLLMCSLIITYS